MTVVKNVHMPGHKSATHDKQTRNTDGAMNLATNNKQSSLKAG